MTEHSDVERLAIETLRADGQVDILVNNGGHYLRVTPFLDGDEEHWDALHAINLLHVFRCIAPDVTHAIQIDIARRLVRSTPTRRAS